MPKSQCCRSIVWVFSQRLRQCSACRRRWRIRLKKRGRKDRRADHRLIAQVFSQRRSLTDLAARLGLTRQALSARLRKVLTRRSIVRFEVAGLGADAILLVDGLWFRFKHRQWVLYLTALRPVLEDWARFFAPVLLEGPESKQAWTKVIGMIPQDIRSSIRAIVGDKFSGCRDIAYRNGWVLQLCHFHLLAQFNGRIKRRSTTKARVLRQEVYKLMDEALLTTDRKRLETLCMGLKLLIADNDTPKRYRSLVRGFFRAMDDYHAYLRYPELRLPRTNGTSEAMGRRIRDLLNDTRSLSTPLALENWATNLVRLKPTIMCRPGSQPLK